MIGQTITVIAIPIGQLKNVGFVERINVHIVPVKIYVNVTIAYVIWGTVQFFMNHVAMRGINVSFVET
jgi:hypothetical protein